MGGLGLDSQGRGVVVFASASSLLLFLTFSLPSLLLLISLLSLARRELAQEEMDAVVRS